MKDIFWSQKSKSDLQDIFEFYSGLANKKVAKAMVKHIVSRVGVLKRQPDLGQEENHPVAAGRNFRYLVVRHYKVVYKVFGKEILIATVFDTRQNPTKMNLG